MPHVPHEAQDELQSAMQTQELPGAGREAAFVPNDALDHLVTHHALQCGVVLANQRLPSGLYGLHLALQVPGHEAEQSARQAEKPVTVKSQTREGLKRTVFIVTKHNTVKIPINT